MDTGDSRRVGRQPERSAAPGEGRMRPRGCQSARSRPAADHAARCRRPRNRCRVRVGESRRWSRPGDSVIRHAAAPRTVGALPIAVVEAAFGAALVARPGGPHRPQAAGGAARLRAVGVAAVAGRADRERPAAHAASPLAERVIHGVGARRAGSDWTTGRGRDTTAPTGRYCRSAGRSRGSGGQTGPSPYAYVHFNSHTAGLFPRIGPVDHGRRDVRRDGDRRAAGGVSRS